jgi:hypothetical protein
MMLGGLIMILGVIIQVTCMKGHKATAQFIIGRTITGIGNGIVNIPALFIIETPLTTARTHLPSQHTKPSVVAPLTEVS